MFGWLFWFGFFGGLFGYTCYSQQAGVRCIEVPVGGVTVTLNRLPAVPGSAASGGHLRSVILCRDHW